MKKNPWENLINKNGLFYLENDYDNIMQNNDDYGDDLENDYYVDLRYVPEPFIGNINAPIYFLLANPGRINNDEELELENLEDNFINDSISNLKHVTIDYPFLYLNPDFQHTSGAKWWNTCLNPIITYLNINREEFSAKFFAVEIYGYHTKKFNSRFVNKNLFLPSINYTISLIQNAIRENKLILIGRSVRKWFNLVDGLSSYKSCFFVANNRQMEISEYTIPLIALSEISNRINGA